METNGTTEGAPPTGVDRTPAEFPIPESVQIAWGHRERASRGPRPGLSLDRVVAAGIAVADAEGYEAISMSRVAAELGSSTMSLYRYVGSKTELLALMLDVRMGVPPPLPAGWREGLHRWTTSVMAGYLQAPWMVRVPIPSPPVTPNQIRWLESGLGAMAPLPLGEQEKLSVILLLSGVARYQGAIAADFAEVVRTTGVADPTVGYGAALLRLITPDEFPAVHRAVVSGSLDDDEDDFPSDQLGFSLTIILDGLAALVGRRSPAPPPSPTPS